MSMLIIVAVFLCGCSNEMRDSRNSSIINSGFNDPIAERLAILSKKEISEYISDDSIFLLHIDKTTFVKVFNLKLDGGNGSTCSDGYYKKDGGIIGTYTIQIIIAVFYPLEYHMFRICFKMFAFHFISITAILTISYIHQIPQTLGLWDSICVCITKNYNRSYTDYAHIRKLNIQGYIF